MLLCCHHTLHGSGSDAAWQEQSSCWRGREQGHTQEVAAFKAGSAQQCTRAGIP